MSEFSDIRLFSFWMGKAMGKTASGHVFTVLLDPVAKKGNLRTARHPGGGHIRSMAITTGETRIPNRRTVWHFEAGASRGYDPDCDPAALALLASRIAKFVEEVFFFGTDA